MYYYYFILTAGMIQIFKAFKEGHCEPKLDWLDMSHLRLSLFEGLAA